jgi:tRNA modification GTPase
MSALNYVTRLNETIAALATPSGNGGIAIIRLSGPKAFLYGLSLVRPGISIESHRAKLVTLFSAEGKPLDKALFLPFQSPRSFTGDDTVELHCHGGQLLARRVLDALVHAGAHIALPGEFTFRAFINGKIDLTQAEAIQDLIGAQNETALQVAEEQLEGRLSQEIQQMQKEGSRLAAIFEAWVDFPEEGLEFAPMEEVLQELKNLDKRIHTLLSTYHDGKLIRDGVSICLLGAPNVGKSSLMNALLGQDRAIVSHIAGTTRDVVEDDLRLDGLHCRLIDTAGIRETEELIEGEGIRRSLKAMKRADLVFIVLDASRPHESYAEHLLKEVANNPICLVWNKIDLLSSIEELPLYNVKETVHVSAKNGEGLEDLKQAVHRLLWKSGPSHRDEVMITNARHKEALHQAHSSLKMVIQGLQDGVSPEFISFDMRHFLTSLGTVIGRDVTEDILTQVFSQFCVGK